MTGWATRGGQPLAAPEDGGPDFASVNWHEGLAIDLATVLRTRHIGVEAGLWTPSAAADFVGRRWPWHVLRVLIEAVPGHTPAATARGLRNASSRRWVPSRRPCWSTVRRSGRGRCFAGRSRGFDTRIGLEDTLFDEAGLRARSNAALVREALTGRRQP